MRAVQIGIPRIRLVSSSSLHSVTSWRLGGPRLDLTSAIVLTTSTVTRSNPWSSTNQIRPWKAWPLFTAADRCWCDGMGRDEWSSAKSGSRCQTRKRLEVGKLNSQFLWFATAFGQRFWKWVSECIPMRIPRGLASVRCSATVNATRHPQDAHWLMSQVPREILSSSLHSGVQDI